jgi:hypothetical protein
MKTAAGVPLRQIGKKISLVWNMKENTLSVRQLGEDLLWDSGSTKRQVPAEMTTQSFQWYASIMADLLGLKREKESEQKDDLFIVYLTELTA